MDFMMLFDNQYCQEGILCLKSILDRSPSSKVFVLCLESVVEESVETNGGIPISLQDFESVYDEIAATKSLRPWAPYTQSLKPFLPEYIFDRNDVEVLTYVDSDFYFWGDPSEIDTEFGSHSFMVTTRGDRARVFFNGGCFTCRDDENCREFLSWWQLKVREWCLWEYGPTEDMFGEEGYLNVIQNEPNRFSGTHVNTHPGINAAPWNICYREITKDGDQIMVDDRPLICYHYRGYAKRQDFFDPGPLDSFPQEALDWIYLPYHNQLPIVTWPPLE